MRSLKVYPVDAAGRTTCAKIASGDPTCKFFLDFLNVKKGPKVEQNRGKHRYNKISFSKNLKYQCSYAARFFIECCTMINSSCSTIIGSIWYLLRYRHHSVFLSHHRNLVVFIHKANSTRITQFIGPHMQC